MKEHYEDNLARVVTDMSGAHGTTTTGNGPIESRTTGMERLQNVFMYIFAKHDPSDPVRGCSSISSSSVFKSCLCQKRQQILNNALTF